MTLDGLEFKQAYEKTTYDLRLKEASIVFVVVLILMPAGGLLDYFYYQENFNTLIKIRLLSVVILSVLFALTFKIKSSKYLKLISTTWPLVINIAICVMIYETEGVLSPYYAGLNLVIVGAAFMTLTLTETIFIVISTFLLYLITITLKNPSVFETNFRMLFNNTFFLFATGILGAIASYVREKQRLTEFKLQYDLDERNKQLAELDRIKSDFFANISHELRTPLTLIISPVEDLLRSDQPFDFKVTQLLTTVKDSSYRLLKLVNDLLSIVRLDENDKQMKCIPVDLKPLLNSIVDSSRYLAKKQDITLINLPNYNSAVINGNISALEKIFINLINNSIKFTPENGTIEIKYVVNTNDVIITIQDSGIGISETDLPHIFERFQQADSSVTRKYQGTGLGLALVRELTLALKGNIEVTSQLNEGTTFTLSFPLYKLKDDEQAVVDAHYENNTTTPDSLEHLHQKADYSLQLNRPDTKTLQPVQNTIPSHNKAGVENHDKRPQLLIVEDEPDLRSYLVNTLSDDYKIFSAADGEVGLELANKHKPDLLVTDLMLPKIDGLSLCKSIKQNKASNFTKVILLTARIDEESKLTALKNGADDFLTKPFSTTELKTRLSNLSKSLDLEKALEKHNKDLTQALKDLKAAESKLLHSEKLNAIGSLASGLLHEVNNPLNYTITAAQILKRNPHVQNDADINEMVDDILEGMDRIKNIVKDLHTFAYPEKVDIQQAFVLADAVQSALRFTASETGTINIEVDIPPQLSVIGSNNHIVQVLINLITNAIKAVKNKKNAKIVISSQLLSDSSAENTTQQQADSKVLVSVRDNGVGIEKEVISRIFEPFFTTRDIGEGLGMGLSICHTIIKNHNGSLNVNSETGKFTVFSFDLNIANPSREL